MIPETKTVDHEETEEAHLQEQSAQYVEDRSRPAAEVLKDQRDTRAEDEAPVLFVP